MSDDAQAAELLEKGIAAVKAGQKEEARQYLLQVVELDEHNEQAWLWLSGIVESAEERRICLENVLTLNPDNAHAQAGLAWLDQQAAEAAGGQDRCPRCQSALPPSGSTCPDCGLPLVVACPACGQYADVERTSCPSCRQPLGDYRQGAAYHLALAQAYLGRQKLDQAQEAMAHAKAEAPGDPQVLAGAGELYEATGRLDQAIAAYEGAIEGAPDDATLYARLGLLYRQRSRSDEGSAMLQKAEELAGEDPAFLYELAQTCLQHNAIPEAIGLLERVIQIQPMNAQAFLLLGDAHLKEYRDEQARRHYGHALQLTSPDSELGREARRKLDESQFSTSAGTEPQYQSRAARSGRRQRPGCVTAYAILLGLGGILGILGVLATAAVITSGRSAMEEAFMASGVPMTVSFDQIAGLLWIYVVVSLVLGGLNVAIAVGLFALKNWARIAVIVVQVLGVLVTLAQTAFMLLSTREAAGEFGVAMSPLPFLCPFVFGFIIQGYIVFWFMTNGEVFD